MEAGSPFAVPSTEPQAPAVTSLRPYNILSILFGSILFGSILFISAGSLKPNLESHP